MGRTPLATTLVSVALAGALAGVSACHAAASRRIPEGSAPVEGAPTATVQAMAKTFVKPPASELRSRLSRIQYAVTQDAATEPPFSNAYWDNHAAGIYVDVVTGEPLFSSLDKFNSGTGWPSFSRPIEAGHVVSLSDDTLGMERTEVRSSAGKSHLGHVFDDGPAPTGMRYCINSASLRFIPADQLVAQGYGAYAERFGKGTPVPEPSATNNACAMPPPGEKPGCEATLVTAELDGPDAAATTLRGVDGVLEVEREGKEAGSRLRVVFDPSRIAQKDLMERWVAAGGRRGALQTKDASRLPIGAPGSTW